MFASTGDDIRLGLLCVPEVCSLAADLAREKPFLLSLSQTTLYHSFKARTQFINCPPLFIRQLFFPSSILPQPAAVRPCPVSHPLTELGGHFQTGDQWL